MRVLYIDVDSLRPDHLGCYGYDRDTSPNIDALADDGLRLTNYYVSDAPCLPSRTALFSGRFGIHTGLINHGGLNADTRPHGSDRGFRYGKFQSWMKVLAENGFYTATLSPFPKRHEAWHVLEGFREVRDPGRNGRERADEIYPLVEQWLDDNAEDDDWFLHVNFWDPHTPYDTPPEYGNPFADDPAPGWLTDEMIAEQYESYGPHSAHEPHSASADFSGVRDLERTPDEIRDREDFGRWVDGYDVGVNYMDHYVGKIVDRLKAHGVFDETLVILSADHGESLGEMNVYGDHQLADEMTCNVPLVVHGPGVEVGVDDGFHYQVDLAPTVTELLGADPDPRWDGCSFAETVRNGTDTGREFLVTSQGAWACQRGVRWADWLLLRTYHDGFKGSLEDLMLFDLADDPHQTTNVADANPAVVRDGLAMLQRWVDDRLVEAAAGENGGNDATPDGVVDPMWQVLREGGPYHTRDRLEGYCRRLRETGREEHAETLERTHG